MTWSRLIALTAPLVLFACEDESPGPIAGRADVRDVSFTEIPSQDTVRPPEPDSALPEVIEVSAELDGAPAPDTLPVDDVPAPTDASPDAVEPGPDTILADTATPDDRDTPDTPDLADHGDEVGPVPDASSPDTCGDGVCDPDEGCLTCPDCACPTRCGTDILISEYLEGTSWNKAIELANFTGTEVDLSAYALWKITNGGAWDEAPAFPLSGLLPHGETLVICHALALPGVLMRCDLPTEASLLEYNGDDALALVHDGEIIDVIGEDGADPGVGWTVSGVGDATAEHTLERRADRLEGSATWSRESQTWEVHERDLVTGLGAHAFAATCEARPPIRCGDFVCEGDEHCGTCADDCGFCPPAVGELVITEIAPHTSQAWFEVRSEAASLRSLDGLTIWAGGVEYALALPPIAPGGNLVLGAEPFVDAPLAGLVIAADADELALEVGGLVIDRVAWSAPLVDAAPVWSLSRGISAADNDAPSLWCAAAGSPGADNPPCPRCGDGTCNLAEDCSLCPSDCGVCPVQACASDLFLSEYVEGSSNNKAIEIANFTGAEVDLSRYAIWKITNGNGSGWGGAKKVPLEGVLPEGATFVFCHAQASVAVLERCDLVSVSTTVTAVDFNGDDAIGLARDGVLIDAIGAEGPDPGTAWPIGSDPLATLDHTLRRAPDVLGPDANWTTAQAGWLVGPADAFADLGQHATSYLCIP